MIYILSTKQLSALKFAPHSAHLSYNTITAHHCSCFCRDLVWMCWPPHFLPPIRWRPSLAPSPYPRNLWAPLRSTSHWDPVLTSSWTSACTWAWIFSTEMARGFSSKICASLQTPRRNRRCRCSAPRGRSPWGYRKEARQRQRCLEWAPHGAEGLSPPSDLPPRPWRTAQEPYMAACPIWSGWRFLVSGWGRSRPVWPAGTGCPAAECSQAWCHGGPDHAGGWNLEHKRSEQHSASLRIQGCPPGEKKIQCSKLLI